MKSEQKSENSVNYFPEVVFLSISFESWRLNLKRYQINIANLIFWISYITNMYVNIIIKIPINITYHTDRHCKMEFRLRIVCRPGLCWKAFVFHDCNIGIQKDCHEDHNEVILNKENNSSNQNAYFPSYMHIKTSYLDWLSPQFLLNAHPILRNCAFIIYKRNIYMDKISHILLCYLQYLISEWISNFIIILLPWESFCRPENQDTFQILEWNFVLPSTNVQWLLLCYH